MRAVVFVAVLALAAADSSTVTPVQKVIQLMDGIILRFYFYVQPRAVPEKHLRPDRGADTKKERRYPTVSESIKL